MAIRYFSDDISFILKEKRKISGWLHNVIAEKRKKTGNLFFIFVSVDKILELNKTYLKKSYLTDIITFDNSTSDEIAGEMYICIDAVKENATRYKVDFRNELLRVMVHGILHLCGYKDKTKAEQEKMREIENKCLEMF